MGKPSPHVTVLLAEAVEALSIQPGGVYVDATFGRGGHSRRILAALGPSGRLIAMDRDQAALDVARGMEDARLEGVHARFSKLQSVLTARGITQVNGVLLDLGVSSPQLDEADRGFSFRLDGPLDMRMDMSEGPSLGDWIAEAPVEEMTRVIRDYGEERFARQVARAIVTARQAGTILSTRQLASIVASAVRTREPGQEPATRTFQAFRIHLNQELQEIEAVLPQAAGALAEGGRIVVISFHSLEDRIVKRFLKERSQPPEIPRGFAIREQDRPRPEFRLVGRAVRPTAQEQAANPRSRSAIMRVAERTAA